MSVNRVDVASVASELAAWFSDEYDDLATLAENTAAEMRRARGKRESIAPRDLKLVRPLAERFLAKHSTPEAAGVILRHGVVGDEGVIEWWKRDEDGTTGRVNFTLTPQTAGFYDFESLEWFSSVLDTGRPAVTGPFVDYAGMDQYILTLTVPFRVDDEIIGVAGCDIEVRSLEAAIMPILRRLNADAALISQHNRIILGNSGRFLVGNRVTEPLEDGIELDVPVHELGLRLIAIPRERY